MITIQGDVVRGFTRLYMFKAANLIQCIIRSGATFKVLEDARHGKSVASDGSDVSSVAHPRRLPAIGSAARHFNVHSTNLQQLQQGIHA